MTHCFVLDPSISAAPPVGYPEILPDVPVMVNEGESVDRLLVCNVSCCVVCSGTNCSCSGANLLWRRSDGTPLSPRIRTETQAIWFGGEGLSLILSIDAVAVEDEGRYLCVAELQGGQTRSAEAFITVIGTD